jgi:hemolysin III
MLLISGASIALVVTAWLWSSHAVQVGAVVGIYLLMGWMAIFGLDEMIEAMPTGALAWLLAGGILFSLGAVIYILKRPNFVPGIFGFHEIWHVFVVLGALSHFILVARYVALG